jgi:hypothetical protein
MVADLVASKVAVWVGMKADGWDIGLVTQRVAE